MTTKKIIVVGAPTHIKLPPPVDFPSIEVKPVRNKLIDRWGQLRKRIR